MPVGGGGGGGKLGGGGGGGGGGEGFLNLPRGKLGSGFSISM